MTELGPRTARAVTLLVATLALSGCQPKGGTTQPPIQPAQNPGMDVAGLVEQLRLCVVNITTTSSRELMLPKGHPRMRMPPARSLGTGFIVDPRGLVVTNVHVVHGATEIKIKLADDRELPARVIGTDPKLDLALLEVPGATNLAAVTLGDSDKLRVGDWVIAIGNPFGLGHTVTIGITSAKGRDIGAGPYDDFIQTDASINPGNSGGPLFNLKGEVVGIPTAIRPGAQGIGFAVPVNALKDILPQLKERGTVLRGRLGAIIQPLTDELAKGLGLDRPRGALVAEVEPGSAAARAGLQPGDVILEINGVAVPRSEDLPRMVARNRPGTLVTLTVFHEGKIDKRQAILDILPNEDDGSGQGVGPEPRRPPPQPDGQAPPPARPNLGLLIEDGPDGAIVREVQPGGAAEGLLAPGDVITEVNKARVVGAEDATKRMESVKGGVLILTVRRGKDTRFVALKVR